MLYSLAVKSDHSVRVKHIAGSGGDCESRCVLLAFNVLSDGVLSGVESALGLAPCNGNIAVFGVLCYIVIRFLAVSGLLNGKAEVLRELSGFYLAEIVCNNKLLGVERGNCRSALAIYDNACVRIEYIAVPCGDLRGDGILLAKTERCNSIGGIIAGEPGYIAYFVPGVGGYLRGCVGSFSELRLINVKRNLRNEFVRNIYLRYHCNERAFLKTGNSIKAYLFCRGSDVVQGVAVIVWCSKELPVVVVEHLAFFKGKHFGKLLNGHGQAGISEILAIGRIVDSACRLRFACYSNIRSQPEIKLTDAGMIVKEFGYNSLKLVAGRPYSVSSVCGIGHYPQIIAAHVAVQIHRCRVIGNIVAILRTVLTTVPVAVRIVDIKCGVVQQPCLAGVKFLVVIQAVRNEIPDVVRAADLFEGIIGFQPAIVTNISKVIISRGLQRAVVAFAQGDGVAVRIVEHAVIRNSELLLFADYLKTHIYMVSVVVVIYRIFHSISGDLIAVSN